jgi:type II secretory pathway pseudopilin PulG
MRRRHAKPGGGIIKRRSRRRAPGFTLVELLLAAVAAAMVTGAAAALTSAVANAASQTRDIRKTKTAGYFALNRIGQTIREARCIGQVTASAVSLWIEDYNGDESVNLYETGVIRYDAAKKQIILEYPQSSGAMPATTVTTTNFKNAATLLSLYPSGDLKSIVWAEGVESFGFVGYPDFTDTKVIEANFVLGTGDDAVGFTTCASPRASADYLFVPAANGPPLPGSNNKQRKKVSKWTGVATS